jgi:hypothetical protein
VYRGPIPKPRSNVLHLNVMNHSKLVQNATADEPACHRTCAGCMTGFRLAMKKLTVASILVLVGKEVTNRSPTRGKPLNWSRFNRSFLHRLSFLCAEWSPLRCSFVWITFVLNILPSIRIPKELTVPVATEGSPRSLRGIGKSFRRDIESNNDIDIGIGSGRRKGRVNRYRTPRCFMWNVERVQEVGYLLDIH